MRLRWLLAAALSCTLGLAQAAPIPSKGEDLAGVKRFLEREDVASALAAHGLTRAEVESRIAQLSPEDLRQLATHVAQVQAAGGEVPRYIWILLAVVLGLLILGAL